MEFASFSDDWIIQLSKGSHKYYLYGYQFEENSASIQSILKDKNALYDLLDYNNIKAVEHWYFLQNHEQIIDNDIRNKVSKLLDRYKVLVLKDNTGTGGYNVYKITCKQELDNILNKFVQKNIKFSVCPYYDIAHEYRIIMLHNKPELIYEKIRPYVEGDGEHSVVSLCVKKYGKDIVDETIDRSIVLAKGEKLNVTWKHNLGLGSEPKIDIESDILSKVQALAIQVSKLLKIGFASVDIVEIGGQLRILEINGGIMMEKFSAYSEYGYAKTKEIYSKALSYIFE